MVREELLRLKFSIGEFKKPEYGKHFILKRSI